MPTYIVSIQAREDDESHETFQVEMTEDQADELEDTLEEVSETGDLYWYSVQEPTTKTFEELMSSWSFE